MCALKGLQKGRRALAASSGSARTYTRTHRTHARTARTCSAESALHVGVVRFCHAAAEEEDACASLGLAPPPLRRLTAARIIIPSDHARLEDTHCHSGVGRTTGKGKVMCQASLGRHVGTRNYKNCPKQQKKKRNCQALPIQEAVSRR